MLSDEGDEGTAGLSPLGFLKDYEGNPEFLDEKTIRGPLRQMHQEKVDVLEESEYILHNLSERSSSHVRI